MANNKDFIEQLIHDYPDIKFVYASRFKYRPSKKTTPATIYLEPLNQSPEYIFQTLHELGHSLRQHKTYTIDVERLKIEREAWDTAYKIFTQYSNTLLKDLSWDEYFVENSLDTYRDWLHARSKCKKCGLTRYQTSDGLYHCPHCENFT